MALIDNLVSYWKLDESSGTALDAHSTNDLADNATVTSGTGVINTARQFAVANGEYLSHADNAALSLGADQAFTIAAWVKLTSKPGTSMGVVSKDDVGAQREYTLFYSATTDRFQIIFWDSGGSAAAVDANNLGSPSTGVWYHVVAWHDPTANEVGIAVNAGTADTTSWTTGTRDTTAAFAVGGFGDGSRTLDGLIDEAGIWKRTLTSQDRSDLYNGGAGLAYPLSVGIQQVGGAFGGTLPLRQRTYRPRPFAPGLAR